MFASKSRRKAWSSLSARAMPMTEKLSGRSFARRRLQSAGTRSRLVRSPAAPKITSTQGGASCASVVMSFGRLDLDMPAELVTHRREQLVGEALPVAGAKAGVQRGRQHIGGDGFFN